MVSPCEPTVGPCCFRSWCGKRACYLSPRVCFVCALVSPLLWSMYLRFGQPSGVTSPAYHVVAPFSCPFLSVTTPLEYVSEVWTTVLGSAGRYVGVLRPSVPIRVLCCAAKVVSWLCPDWGGGLFPVPQVSVLGLRSLVALCYLCCFAGHRIGDVPFRRKWHKECAVKYGMRYVDGAGVKR